MPADASPVGTDPVSDFWERSRVGWHVTMYGVLAVACLPPAVTGDVVSVVAGAVLGVVYAAVGIPALARRDERLGAVYVTVAYAVFAVLALRDSSGFSLLFVLYPQTFALFDRRPVTLGLAGLLSVLMGVAVGITAGDWGTGTLTALVNFGVAALLGLWIDGVLRESGKRAVLLAQLESTRSELADAHRREGVLAERERLSQEIHDTLAQGFTSVVMLSRVASRALVTGDTALAADRLAAVETVARENLAEARALVAALAPPPLQESPLPEALDRIVDRFRHECEIETSYAVVGDARPLPPHAEVVLLRAAQEALANVRRHSAARAVQVRLCFDAGSTSLEVRDDGQGFDTSACTAQGFGLRGMQARLDEVGGRLAVDSADGAGTRVLVEV
ncbi:signal transduction histidine kinase [Motilibacter peucedani]|uniref:Signal transduction histidine kinase n=1 Tax=Motilibacter peucedani TaxID=598650 RepID=A0A420XM15_9ACTN|nr:sensor histidine kinase [Motilibacter peucedani]RKS71348.1 signal transduction histidine kinase [Motilibacter peucedani]